MPIDTSMYSQMQAPDILGGFEKGMRLSDMMRDRKLKDQELKENQLFKDVMRQNTDESGNVNRQATLSMLAKGGYSPEKAMALQKQWADLDASDINLQSAKLKQQADQSAFVANLLGGVKDQGGLDLAFQKAEAAGIDTSKYPRRYDGYQNFWMDQADQAMTAAQRHDNEWRKSEAARAQSNSDREFGLKEKELAQKAKAQKSDSAGNLGKLAADLRKERSGLPTTKTTQDVAAAFNRIQASAQKQTPASDMSLIFNYMKMLDPGSTVREGEYANAEQTRGIPADIVARYNKAREGTMLDPAQREDFLNQAAGLYQSQLDIQNRIDSQYSDYARQAGLDPRNVIVDFGANVLPQKRQAGNAPPAPKHGAVEDNYVFMGGDPSDPKSWKPVSKTASRFRTEME